MLLICSLSACGNGAGQDSANGSDDTGLIDESVNGGASTGGVEDELVIVDTTAPLPDTRTYTIGACYTLDISISLLEVSDDSNKADGAYPFMFIPCREELWSLTCGASDDYTSAEKYAESRIQYVNRDTATAVYPCTIGALQGWCVEVCGYESDKVINVIYCFNNPVTPNGPIGVVDLVVSQSFEIQDVLGKHPEIQQMLDSIRAPG
jgi:hypothetical protein